MIEWIVPEADRKQTPKCYAAGHSLVKPLLGVVLHYTAGSFKSALVSMTAPDKGGSAHFLIGRDGRTVQLAKLTERTWHAEAPNNGSMFLGNPRVNSITVGIELENFGFLEPIVPAGGAGKQTGWKAWMGTVVPDAQVIVSAATVVPGFEKRGQPTKNKTCGWQTYPDVQIKALDQLLLKLEDAGCPQLITTHESCDPMRKFDVGPALAFDSLMIGNRVDARHRRNK